jgi:hypothetical protein
MIDFAYFGETYTNNIWIHGSNYTVLVIHLITDALFLDRSANLQ